jgi:hypothetical protein
MYFFLLMLLPILFCLAAYLLHKQGILVENHGLGEALCTLVVCAIITGAGLALEFYGVTTDTEIWSGSITQKQREEVSCRHSYKCNCYTTTDKDGHSEEHCSTCYEHSFDVDWDLYFSTGKEMSIDTVDRQGLTMPPRWAAAYVGEPTTEAHTFTNYLLASPDNVLMHHDVPTGFSGLIPKYPDEVYDYYRTNRFLLAGGVPVKGEKEWRWLLDKMNADLGSVKQVNIIIILAYTNDPRYEYALEKEWVGGKKNDLIVVIGTTQYPKIDWVRIVSWCTSADIKVLLRDEIQDIGTLDKRDEIMGDIRKEVTTHFHRRHMKDMKYLAASHQPSGWVMFFILFLELAAAFVVPIAYSNIEDNYSYRRRYY